MGRFPARLLLLALTGLCLADEELELVTAVQGDSFSTRCHYNHHKYALEEKFWCKMLSDWKYDPSIFLTVPSKGGKYLNIAPKRRVSLTDSGTGWISASMTELQIEDSGTYLCGILDHQTIIPLKKIKVVVSYDAPMRLSAKKGDSVSLNCSYFVDDNRRCNNFTWCKMVSATRCQPVISVEINRIVNTRGRTKIKIDRWNRVIIVTLVALQLQDSGEYQCETHLQGSTVLLKMITLNVLEKSVSHDTGNEATSPPTNEGETTHPTVANNKEQRTLYVVLALSSFLAGSALIAIMAAIFTKWRKRGTGLNFGEHSSCRLAAQQRDEGHPRAATPDGELKNGIIYAMLRLQPKPKLEDVTYANVVPPPKPENAKHSAEPTAVLYSSGTMEYATIIFGDSPPLSGTKQKQTGPK